MNNEKPCPGLRRQLVVHGSAQEPHTCPYSEEIDDDHETLCECCKACERECSDDI